MESFLERTKDTDLDGLVAELASRRHGNKRRSLRLAAWKFTVRSSYAVKRMLDIVGSGVGMVLLSPVYLAIAIAVKMSSPGPVFFVQTRVGRYGRHFRFYKFRSMRQDAEALKDSLKSQNESKDGVIFKMKDDPRITKVGKFLRKTRIDELPQILCVLKGDMSMVGPRPERAVFISKLREQIPFYISRLKMKPGLTGWAQVRHHYDTSIEDVQIKLQYDMYYYENMSLLVDFQILARTVYVVLTGKGAQ